MIEREYADLEEVWLAEKAAVQGAIQIKSDIEQAKLNLVSPAGSGGSAARDSAHGLLPDLERRLLCGLRRRSAGADAIRSRVTEEEVAEVVSRWTGIPIAKMLEGDREKLYCAWKRYCTSGWSDR